MREFGFLDSTLLLSLFYVFVKKVLRIYNNGGIIKNVAETT